MYKHILLCTDGSPAAIVATDYAIWFAKKLSGHLHALYITDIRLLEGPLLADIAGALGAAPYPALLPQLQQLQRDRADAILRAVQQRCREAHVPCELAHQTGNLTQVMLEHEKRADLVVLGQRGEHAPWSAGLLGSSVERMVRASIKPCLVTPEKFRQIKHILIAHDGSVESNKALHAGLGLAAALDTDTTILTVCQREQEESASKTLHDALQQARRHKLKAQAQLAHGTAETEILAFADKLGADLIVMGAYGHTRIRELILGSTTSQVLRKTTVPVLLVRGPKEISA
jgi:nucleotide-binding universal stress UspA family protein